MNAEHENISRDEMMAALFANLVVQQTNMALIFLGHAPHPQTGQKEINLEHARFFIDQLEMLEAKTKGNLDKQEEGMLKQSLTSLRMAFVEAVQKEAAQPATTAPAQELPKEATAPSEPAPEQHDDDSKKKFSKKY
jgi:hypothetical protein